MYLSIKEFNRLMPKYDGVHFEPFEFQHAIDIDSGEFHGYSTQRMVGVQRMMEEQANHGFAFTCFLHNEPVASFGTTYLWEMLLELSLLP
jgi:hypothetical protein